MNQLEADKRLLEIQKENAKSMKEYQNTLKNIFADIKMIIQRPGWEKLYKEKLIGIFIDWSDQMYDNEQIYKKELEKVGLR